MSDQDRISSYNINKIGEKYSEYRRVWSRGL